MWTEMVHNHTTWTVIARYDELWPYETQHIQFGSVFDKCVRKGYVWVMSPASGIYCKVMASTGPVWTVLGNGGRLWSRISSLNELVHFKAELWVLGLVFQVIACMALRDKIGRIWSSVAYNGPVFVIVSRYDRLRPYLSLHYVFWAALALSVRLEHNKIKVSGKSESGQKWSIIIQNVLS